MEETDTKFILSIDGGGIRGLVPAKILTEIEKRVTEELKKENPNADMRCADFFDILAGTSTGSILALALAVPENDRPKYSGSFMVDFFQKHGNDVFPNYSPFGHVDNLLKNITNVFKGVDLSHMATNVVNVVKEETLKIETNITNRSVSKDNNGSDGKAEKKGFIERFIDFLSPSSNSPDKDKMIQNNETNNRDIGEIKNKVEQSVSTSKTNVTKSNTEIVTTDVSIDVTTTNDEKTFKEHLFELQEFLKSYDPFGPKYDPSGFEKLLNENFKDLKLKDAVNGVKVFITSYNLSQGKRVFFTNLTSEHEDNLMKDVVRASAAAPTFFPAKNLSSKYYIDGGVFMNNPTSKTYLEAKKKYPNSKFVVISLGTGYYPKPLEKYNNAGIVQWVSPLISLLMDMEQVNHHNTMKMLAEFDGTTYYRIQPVMDQELNLADVGDEDVKKLLALGDKAINDPDSKLDEIVNLLVDKCKKK
ncbi:25365_t:CDS:1 [Dentiscutata erythropus]|uniref:25365_t:CDS:1 n=1 Tax=Dentiscutata erythropus TaxID=1348616 RepID=A0A9N9IPE8_9GLOM|nr:25365_t:CDS:1 [Dentiscutata erythropus]